MSAHTTLWEIPLVTLGYMIAARRAAKGEKIGRKPNWDAWKAAVADIANA